MSGLYGPDVADIRGRAPSGAPWGAALADTPAVVVVTVLTEWLVWSSDGPGDPITGPRALTAMLPLLLAAPLWWRRRRPLLTCALVMSGLVGQALLSGHAAEGLYGVVASGLASYSVAAHSLRRRALVGLAVVLVGYGVWMAFDANVRSGRAGELWAASFFALYLVAAWLVGSVLQTRRLAARAAARSAAVEREAERAVAEERARIARDLHDIVSHNLSVLVVQAAGGRARAEHDPAVTAATLEKIESTGRQALVEMRRLLGVLRTGDEPGAASPALLAPTPGIEALQALARTVREAGVDVSLSVDTAGSGVPGAVQVSAYRIVQEALTNVLKHAGPGARADVVVRVEGQGLMVAVSDDGRGPSPTSGLGHGLRGMRERVTVLGGELRAGGRPEGGFLVSAWLPRDEPT